jgi:hypothetical protein
LIKKLLLFVLIVAAGVGIWVAFALWTGIYSVYTYPPSKDHPKGSTLLVSRESGEPMFNSPRYVPPPKPVQKGGGIGFAPMPRASKPLATRTIIELPYIEWAFKKSLEKEEP